MNRDDRFDLPRYADRNEAGRRLAAMLPADLGADVLVLGVPRGGVPVAAAIADAIGAELDIVAARKLRAPLQPELAIGAVTADGGLYLDEDAVAALGVDRDYLSAEIARQTESARRRRERLRGEAEPPRIAGRTVVVVDDGLATGATMRAAVHAVAKRQPARIVVAVPVGSRQACESLQRDANAVVCPLTPEPFWAVGLYYDDFAPVEDDDITRVLREFRAGPASPGAPSTTTV